MTLPPEKIGDKGQRYAVLYRDKSDPDGATLERCLGYSPDSDGAEKMAASWRLHPAGYEVWVVDRDWDPPVAGTIAAKCPRCGSHVDGFVGFRLTMNMVPPAASTSVERHPAVDAEREGRPFYRDDDEQFRPRKVDDESLAQWEQEAALAIRHMLPGGINWPMIVRSLIAELAKLRAENAGLREALERIKSLGTSYSTGAQIGRDAHGWPTYAAITAETLAAQIARAALSSEQAAAKQDPTGVMRAALQKIRDRMFAPDQETPITEEIYGLAVSALNEADAGDEP